MAANLEELVLKCDDGSSYTVIVGTEEADKIRSDPAYASKFVTVKRQLGLEGSTLGKKTKQSHGEIPEEQDTSHWPDKAVRLLIILRTEMDGQFEKPLCRKWVLWEELGKKMNEVGGYNVRGSMCNKKWRNLLVTYRRIKDGRNKDKSINWEHYDLMDEWYNPKKVASNLTDTKTKKLHATVHNSNTSRRHKPSAGSSTSYDLNNELTTPDPGQASKFTLRKHERRTKCKHLQTDEAPKWFECFLQQRKADQEKRFELEERRLALEAAQVKALQTLVAAISSTLKEQGIKT